MKKILLSLVALVSIAKTIMAQTVPNYVPTNGLVGWWPFNGNANDESGNGNNGTVNGATLTTDRFGNANKAYNFIGSATPSNSGGGTQYIGINLNPELNLMNFNGLTLSGWFTLNDLNAISSVINIHDQSSNRYYGIAYDKNSNNLFTDNGTFNNVPTTNLQGNINPIPNNWYHVLSVNDFINNSMKIYINGTLQGQITNTLTRPNMTNINFGAYLASNGYWFANGKLDDMGIWNRALTQEEIIALYTNCSLTTIITPSTALVNAGANAQFTASSSVPSATYQWQTNPNETSWQNVPSNTKYSGATSNTLTVNNVQLGNHNQPFRVIATAGNCVDTSATAFIQIADTCVNTVIDTNYVNQTIYDTTHVTVTDTNYVTVYDTVTTYTSVTDTLYIAINTVGLNNNAIVNTIKVFPNPSNSILNLHYGNYATLSNYRVKITNALGQTIYDQAITQQSEVLDLSTFGGNGIYYLSILNPQGNVIEVRKIVLQ